MYGEEEYLDDPNYDGQDFYGVKDTENNNGFDPLGQIQSSPSKEEALSVDS